MHRNYLLFFLVCIISFLYLLLDSRYSLLIKTFARINTSGEWFHNNLFYHMIN